MTQQTSNPSLLKDAREAKGLTLEIVHEATKIPLDALKAIEQGYSVRILTPFYYRGFIKIYAEFLGLDVKEVFKAYNIEKQEVKIAQPAASAPVAKPAAVRPKPFKPKIPWVSQPDSFAPEFLRGLWTPQSRMLIGRVCLAGVAIFLLVKIGGCIGSYIKMKPKTKAAQVSGSMKTVKEKPKAAVPVARSTVLEAQPAAVTTSSRSVTSKVQVALRAMKDSWIQVKSDGNVVFAMTMAKGTIESWEANEKIEISGKNLGELQWEVNGKELGSLGAGQRRAKRVVITKEGLSVKK